MSEPTDQPAQSLRTWRPMVLWTTGILLLLGLVWFGATVGGSIHRINTLAEMYDGLDREDMVNDLGGPERALPQLRLYVRLPSWVAKERPFAAESLGYCGKAALPILMRLLESEDQDLRYGSAWALRQLRHDAGPAVSKRVPLLDDISKPVRMAASCALREIGPDAYPAVPRLIAALNDNDAQIRYEAALTLGEIGPAAKEAISALERAVSDEDRQASNAASIALNKIRGEGAEK